MAKRIISFLLCLVMAVSVLAPAYAIEDAAETHLSKDPFEGYNVLGSVPAKKQGTIQTYTFKAANGSSARAGLYLPYNYDANDENTVYDVLIYLQGKEPNNQITPLNLFQRSKGKQVLDYAIYKGAIKPLIVLSVPERFGRSTDVLEGLITSVQKEFNVYGPNHKPTDAVRNHWAIGGMSSGASYVKSKILQTSLYKKFAYIGFFSCLGGGGDNTNVKNIVAKDKTLKMKLFITTAGNRADEWGNNDAAANGNAVSHQKIWGTYAKRTIRWTFDGFTHSSWQTEAGALFQFAKESFRPDPVEIDVSINKDGTIAITWDEADGASKYQVFMSDGDDDDYKRIFTVSGTEVTYSKVEAGKTYRFYVRAVTDNGHVSLDSNIVKIKATIPAAIVIAQSANAQSGGGSGSPAFSWGKIKTAAKYQVYMSKTGKSGSFNKLATVTTNAYRHTAAKPGVTYYYKVRGVASDGTLGSFSSVIEITAIPDAPDISVTLSTKGKPVIAWDTVNGAEKYKIYRAVGTSGTFKLLGTTSALKYTNTGAESEKTYTYKVCAVMADGTKGVFSAPQRIVVSK